MPMMAVLFTPENYALVLDRMELPNEEMLRIKRTTPTQGPLYFIPDFTNQAGEPFGSWVIVRQDYLDENFTYNKDWINIRFVTLTRK